MLGVNKTVTETQYQDSLASDFTRGRTGLFFLFNLT